MTSPLDPAVRQQLAVSARFIAREGTMTVSLDDLSLTGARITLPRELRVTSGVLAWLDIDCFASVAWQKGDQVGLRFDRPITAQCLEQTERAARGG